MGAIVFMILSSFRVLSLLSIWLAVAIFSYFVFALPQPSGLYSISNFPEGKNLGSLIQNACVQVPRHCSKVWYCKSKEVVRLPSRSLYFNKEEEGNASLNKIT